MASPSGPPGAPARLPAGYAPPFANPRQPSPNALAGHMQNLQIGSASPPPPPGAVPPAAGAPFQFASPPSSFPGQAPISRPGPPTRPAGAPSPFTQTQRPFGAPAAPTRPQVPPPIGSITSNGPSATGPPGQRFPPPSSLQQQQPGPPASVPPASTMRAPGSAPPQVQNVRPFPGSPPSGASMIPPGSQPFPGHMAPQPIPGGLPASQVFHPGSSPIRPFAGPPATSRPVSGLPQTSQPFSGGAVLSQFPGPPFPQTFPGRPASQTASVPPISMPFSAMPMAQPPSGPWLPPAFPGTPTPHSFAAPTAPPTFSRPPASATPYGSPMLSTQSPLQGPPAMPGSMQPPPRMYGMPPPPMGSVPGTMGHSLAGAQGSSPSKIDPNQIPRPMPSSSVTVFDTRQGNQANVPPPASSDYIVKDTGNCSPRFMRCTLNQIPCTNDILSTSSMPLALMVQPLALPHPSEEPIQIVDFGEGGPVRCSRCKGYINPFMKFIDQGKRFICNLCGEHLSI